MVSAPPEPARGARVKRVLCRQQGEARRVQEWDTRARTIVEQAVDLGLVTRVDAAASCSGSICREREGHDGEEDERERKTGQVR